MTLMEQEQKGKMAMKKLAEKLEEELEELEYIHGLLEGILHELSIQLKKSQGILNDLKNKIEESEDD